MHHASCMAWHGMVTRPGPDAINRHCYTGFAYAACTKAFRGLGQEEAGQLCVFVVLARHITVLLFSDKMHGMAWHAVPR
jgi:hypothetical protein